MTEPRLASHMLVGALIRATESAGGFASVLRKGDRVAGDICLVCLVRGQDPCILRRAVSFERPAVWEEVPAQSIEKQGGMESYLERRSEIDPDIWLIELDIAQKAHLADILGTAA